MHGQFKRWLLAVAVLALGLSGRVGAAGADGIAVERSAFAAAIQGREPDQPLGGSDALAPGPAWFFTSIAAGADFLEQLRREGRLPLYHVWHRISAGHSDMGSRPDFRKELALGDVGNLAGLRAEVDSLGYFTWRTASCRRDLPAGQYRVDVRDRRGDKVPCATATNCVFYLKVAIGGLRGAPCR